mgnify:CR=1 FL=1
MKIRCPYCFQEFDNSKAMLICCNTLNRCKLETTPEYTQYWKDFGSNSDTPRPHVYKGGWSLMGAPKIKPCPICGDDVPNYVCPHCHNALPKDMVLYGPDIIPVIGGPGTGKTCFMLALLQQLNKYGSRVNLISFVDSMYGEEYKAYEDMTKTLFATKMMPDKTSISDNTISRPWFIRIENHNKKKSTKPTYLIFYDIAGEQFEDANIMLCQGALRYASGAIVLLDSFDLPVVQDLLKSLGKTSSENHFSIEKTVKELFNITSNHEKILQNKPIAFAFSKVDILDKYRASLKSFENTVDLKQNSFFLNRKYAGKQLSADDFNQYLMEIDQKDHDFRNALVDCDMENMLHNNNWDEKNVEFFGVSSLGAETERDGSLNVDKVSPYRVADPLVWVMHKLGKIGSESK